MSLNCSVSQFAPQNNKKNNTANQAVHTKNVLVFWFLIAAQSGHIGVRMQQHVRSAFLHSLVQIEELRRVLAGQRFFSGRTGHRELVEDLRDENEWLELRRKTDFPATELAIDSLTVWLPHMNEYCLRSAPEPSARSVM